MSNSGQPIDPVMALAAQQQSAPVPVAPPSQSLDPVQLLAAGNSTAEPATSFAYQKHPTEASGVLPTIVRNITNAATFNLADPLAAAADATIPIDKGSSGAPDWVQRFKDNLSSQRAATNEGQQAHPYIALGSSVAGGIANPVARALPVAQSLGGAVLQGAGLGAGYGAGGAIGNSKNVADALKQTGTGAVLGGASGLMAGGLGKLLAGATRTPEAQLLADEGVPLTIGQGLGGTAKTLEDSTTHIPLVGNMIKSRQSDAIDGFNRATYNRVLEPLGIKYDASAPAGNEAIDKISNIISDAYGKAYDGARIVKSQPVLDALDTATDESSGLLPKDKLAQIQANIHRLVNGKFDENGVLDSAAIKTAKNFFAEQSRAGPTASLEDRATASAYGNVVSALKSGIAESDPEHGAMLKAADSAYARFVPIQGAASSNNANSRAGIFTASQLGQALRSADNSVRHGAFAKGMVPMQDLAQAGQAVLPSSVPDSGTATRGLMEAAPWLMAAGFKDPAIAVGGAGGLASGSALYSRPGQALARALLHGAPNARRAMGAIPPTMLPGFVAALTASGGSKP